MVSRVFGCDRNRLHQLIADDLNDQQSDEAVRHVEACDDCLKEMESLAADAEVWRDIPRFLQRDAHDAPATLAGGPGVNDHNVAVQAVLDHLAPSDNPAMLGRLGGYEILEVVGRGGMGVVLKGFDRELNRYVAVKVLSPHYAASSPARKRFAGEAQAAAAVVHQHVVPIHAVAGDAPLPYFVMQFVAGQSLQQRINADAPLELCDILRISIQVAQGLSAAHAHGIVHRDVKPENILLENGVDRVLLSDFGLARAVDDASLTRSGVIAGTPQFMSPEQARDDSIDARSDLFSLGSVMYAMCAGRPPFRAETSYGVLRRIIDTEPRSIREVNPRIPDWLEALIGRLLAKDPARRFQSAEELAEMLGQWLAHLQHPATPPPGDDVGCRTSSQPVRIRRQKTGYKPSLRRPGRLVIAMAAILILAGVVFFIQLGDDPAIQRKIDQAEPSFHAQAGFGAGSSVHDSADDPAKAAGGSRFSATSKDGKLIVKLTLNDVSLHDAATGKMLAFRRMEANGKSITFSDDGRELSVVTAEGVRHYAVASLTLLRFVPQPARPASKTDATRSQASSQDASLVAYLYHLDGRRPCVEVINTQTRDLIKIINLEVPGTSVAFSENRRELGVVTREGVRYYESRSGKLVRFEPNAKQPTWPKSSRKKVTSHSESPLFRGKTLVQWLAELRNVQVEGRIHASSVTRPLIAANRLRGKTPGEREYLLAAIQHWRRYANREQSPDLLAQCVRVICELSGQYFSEEAADAVISVMRRQPVIDDGAHGRDDLWARAKIGLKKLDQEVVRKRLRREMESGNPAGRRFAQEYLSGANK